MPSLSQFRPNQTAQKVDSALKSALIIKDQAHQCSLDWFGEILNRKLFMELGYSSINQYARQELGFGNSKIGDYIKLTRKLEKLPHLKASLNKGELGYTKGRLLTNVVDEKNEQAWLKFALENPRKELEAEVKRAKQEIKYSAARQPSLLPPPKRKTPAAVVPVRVHLEMSPTQYARYEIIWEKIRKQKNLSTDKAEALLEIMESFLTNSTPQISPREKNSQPPAQIHIHHCPECEAATVQTLKGELEIGKTEFQRYQCDCLTTVSGGRNKASIPPATRRKILAKARHQCSTPGCIHNRFLEIHHIKPRSAGGSNHTSNLRVFCSACHSRIHSFGSDFMVKDIFPSYCSGNIGQNTLPLQGQCPTLSPYAFFEKVNNHAENHPSSLVSSSGFISQRLRFNQPDPTPGPRRIDLGKY